MIKRVIGNCTLYNGSSTEIVPQLGEIDSIVSDPPYGMSYEQSDHRKYDRFEKIQGDETPDLLRWTTDIKAKHSKYIFCRWDNLYDVKKPKSLITWVKNNWTIGDVWHGHGRQTEVILFYNEEEHYWTYKRPSDVVNCPITGNKHHPTEKPVQLMMTVVSWTHGTVVDPFMGSGATGVACVKTGRPDIGIELEKSYFETACKRIEEAQRQGGLFNPRREIPQEQEKFDL